MKPKKIIIISVLLIIILGFAAYFNSLKGGFIWDDDYLVKKNVYIRNWANIPNIFTRDIGKGAGMESNSYRPLQMLIFMADYSVWKLNPVGYHITNLFFHILAALCVYWFINILFGDNAISLITALFFVVHPAHTEAVSYISGGADPMALAFMLLCFIFYIKYGRNKENRDSPLRGQSLFSLTVLAYAAALLSREISLILPALLLLYHYAFKKKIGTKLFLSVLAVTLTYIIVRITLVKLPITGEGISTTVFQRMPGFFVALSNYARLLILPFDLHMEYGDPVFYFRNPKALAALFVSMPILIYAFRKRTGDKLIFFSVFWFFITLLPQSNIFPLGAYMAEHWLYAPSIGFFLLLASVIARRPERPTKQSGVNEIASVAPLGLPRNDHVRVAVALTLVAFYSYLTIKQNGYWSEPVAFYRRTMEYAPFSARLHNDMGIAYFQRGVKEEARTLFEKAIKLDPRYSKAYNNLGVMYYNMGKIEEAKTLFEKALELDPNYADTYNNLGNLYKARGENEKAVSLFKKAIEFNPLLDEAYVNLGSVYGFMGKNEEAIAMFKKAVELDSTSLAAYNNLGNAYKDMERYNDALKAYNKALELNPNSPEVRYNIELLLKEVGIPKRF